MSAEMERFEMQVNLSARILAESCESCLQNPAEFIVHETFVCVDCAKADR